MYCISGLFLEIYTAMAMRERETKAEMDAEEREE